MGVIIIAGRRFGESSGLPRRHEESEALDWYARILAFYRTFRSRLHLVQAHGPVQSEPHKFKCEGRHHVKINVLAGGDKINVLAV